MDVTLKFQPAFSLAFVKVGPNEEIRVEPGAMVSHTAGMTMNTKAEGGLFGGLKRMVAGESFFQNTWKAIGQKELLHGYCLRDLASISRICNWNF